MESFEESSTYDEIISAYKKNDIELFKELVEDVNKDLLFMLLLEIGSQGVESYRCYEYLQDYLVSDLDESQIILCTVANLEKLDKLYNAHEIHYDKNPSVDILEYGLLEYDCQTKVTVVRKMMELDSNITTKLISCICQNGLCFTESDLGVIEYWLSMINSILDTMREKMINGDNEGI